MSKQTNEYLVITNKMSWGAGPTIEKARANAFSHNIRGQKACEFVQYHFPDELIKDFGHDDFGGAWWYWRDEVADDQRDDNMPRMGMFERKRNGHITRIAD